MSADKRKKFLRACDMLREVNCGRYPSGPITRQTPTLRYIIKRGMAKLKRARRWRHMTTYLDTGVPWARRYERRDG